mmetsp:Transcript_56958/g.78990  ORF Transcript_56958/g.78990 Transcript_56958/m.78990 type:complete len:244 (+) Transcript_56958:32-763(+)
MSPPRDPSADFTTALKSSRFGFHTRPRCSLGFFATARSFSEPVDAAALRSRASQICAEVLTSPRVVQASLEEDDFGPHRAHGTVGCCCCCCLPSALRGLAFCRTEKARRELGDVTKALGGQWLEAFVELRDGLRVRPSRQVELRGTLVCDEREVVAAQWTLNRKVGPKPEEVLQAPLRKRVADAVSHVRLPCRRIRRIPQVEEVIARMPFPPQDHLPEPLVQYLSSGCAYGGSIRNLQPLRFV